MNVLRQTAYLIVACNLITVDNVAVLFNCTPVRRVSDLMIAPT